MSTPTSDPPLHGDLDHLASLKGSVRRTLSHVDWEAKSAVKGTLSGEGGDGPRGTLSGGSSKSTLSGSPSKSTLSGSPAKGTLSGAPSGGAAAGAKATLTGSQTSGRRAYNVETDSLAEVREAPDAKRDGVSAPDLEALRPLGQGGMGIVWLAIQKSLDRPVAVKTLRPEFRDSSMAERFAAEAMITGKLEHPNIPPVHAYGRDDLGRPFLSMKLVKGLEWGELLVPRTAEQRTRAERISLPGHLRILQRVCEAIAFAHSHGIIHRDLKPENVMVGEFGEVLVMDWGIALDLKKRGDAVATKGPRRPVGTPAYLAPEMAAADESKMGPWTDTFLLGGLLYELLTGQTPHRGEGILEVLLAAQKGVIEPPHVRAPGRIIPVALADTAMKALSPDPAKRFQSALEFQDAIEDYLKGEASRQLVDVARGEMTRLENAITYPNVIPAELYSGFSTVVAEFAQALQLWHGNREAMTGLVRARITYARFALKHGDTSIAETQLRDLRPEDPATIELRKQIDKAHADHRADVARKKTIKVLVGGLVLVVIIVCSLAFREMLRADKAVAAGDRRQQAVRETQDAVWLKVERRIEAYKKGLAIDPTWADGWAALGRAYLERSYANFGIDAVSATAELEAAVEPFDRAVKLDPNNAKSVGDRAYMLEMRGDLTAALPSYRKALEVGKEGGKQTHPGAEAETVLAFAEGNWQGAIRGAQHAIEIEDGETDYFRRAAARFCDGDLDGAIQDCIEADKIIPGDEQYCALWAAALLAKGASREAEEKLLTGLQGRPHGPHLLSLLAYAAAKEGDLPRALAIAAEAKKQQAAYAKCFLALDPCWRSLATAKGPVADKVGRAEILDLDLSTIVPAQPAPALALRRQAESALEKGDAATALGLVAQTIAEDPADGAARLVRARCLIALGRGGAAGPDLEMVGTLAPDLAEEAARAGKTIEGGK